MYNMNPYLNNTQYNQSPYASYGYNGYGYQSAMPTQQVTKPTQPQNFPFSIVRFGTLDEIKGQLVSPSSAIMFIKNDLSEMYIKSADAMGNSALETFKCSRVTDNPTLPQTPAIDTEIFAKREELKNFVTADDIKALPTREDMDNFAKKMHSMEDEIKKGFGEDVHISVVDDIQGTVLVGIASL